MCTSLTVTTTVCAHSRRFFTGILNSLAEALDALIGAAAGGLTTDEGLNAAGSTDATTSAMPGKACRKTLFLSLPLPRSFALIDFSLLEGPPVILFAARGC